MVSVSTNYNYDELLKLVSEAHEDLMDKITWEEIPNLSGLKGVKRSVYTEAMKEVQKERGITQGHPAFLMWTLYQIGHSPIIIEDEDGEDIESE